MFLAQIKNYSRTEFWRYLIGSLIIIGFSLLGQGLLMLGWWLKLGTDALQNTSQSKLMNILGSMLLSPGTADGLFALWFPKHP